MMIPSQVLLIPHFVLYEALGLRMYQTATGSWINLLMAASLLSLLPLALAFLLGQRYLMRWRVSPASGV